MTKGLGRFLLGCFGLWCFGLLWLLPVSPAWADKAVEPLMFKAGEGAIAVISLYETDPATQADAVKSFYKTTKSFYKTIPGFYGLALFSSADGERVVELGQWQDQASYDAFQTTLASGGADDYTKYYEQYASGKGKGGGPAPESASLGEPFLTASFAIDQVVSPPGMVAAIPGPAALVQISEIATDTPAHQASLMAAAQTTLASLPQLYPAPRTAILLRGIDTSHIALLANWGSSAEFSDLDQVPQLALAIPPEGAPETVTAGPDETADPLTFTTDSHLYQTIKVITPKAEKYGKS
ncbi:MAG TPA: hypothetical protein VLS96_14050 [Nodosilinea sp.]|nr:hypothetical protein [Nodosilinea sp.]